MGSVSILRTKDACLLSYHTGRKTHSYESEQYGFGVLLQSLDLRGEMERVFLRL